MFTLNPLSYLEQCIHEFFERKQSRRRKFTRLMGAVLAVETLEDRVVPNAAPVAVADSYDFHQGQALNVSAAGVLANDTDADDDSLNAVLDTDVSHGSLTLNSDGSFTYFPGTEVATTDSFIYYANDGTVNSDDPVTVTLTLVNAAPVASNQNYTIHQGRILDVPMELGMLVGATDADDDSLEVIVDEEPTYGSFDYSSDGSFTYTAGTEQSESDSFTFHVRDGAANSSTMTVSLTFDNTAPVLPSSLSYTVLPTGSLALNNNLLANATDDDEDGYMLSFEIDASPTHGTITSGVYTPNSSSWTGSDSFTYHVSDGVADSNIVTVNITIANSAIIANPVLAQTYTDEEVVITQSVVLANTMSQTTTPWIISYNDYTPASHGTVTQDGNGDFHYVPDDGYTGADSFSYTIYDGTNSVTSTIDVSVQQTRSATFNFAQLANVTGTDSRHLSIHFRARDPELPVFNFEPSRFTAQADLPNVICTAFCSTLTAAGWHFERSGNVVTVTYHQDDLGNRSWIRTDNIPIHGYGTLTDSMLPTVVIHD
jgi:large repetitive protein